MLRIFSVPSQIVLLTVLLCAHAQIVFQDDESPDLLRIVLSTGPALTVNHIHRLKSLCPGSAPQNLYRYHNETGECFRIGIRGPCKKGMLFFYHDEVYGGCDCTFSDRILIFHQETQSCYPIFSQGYCKPKEWLMLDPYNFQPACLRNVCIQRSRTLGIDLVPFKGRCVELESKSKHCKQDEVVRLLPDKLEPSCGPPRDAEILPVKVKQVPEFRCTPGSVLSVTGKCQAGQIQFRS